MPKSNGDKPTTLGGEVTCIKVTKETRAKLSKLGSMGDTYETVINSLIAENTTEGDSDESP